MKVAASGNQGVAEQHVLGPEVEMTVAVNLMMKEPSSAALSCAALLTSTPSRNSASLRDSASAPGTEGTMSDADVMVIPLKNPGLGPRTPNPAG